MTHIQQGVALGYARIHLCGVVPDHAPAGRLGPTSETPYAVSDLQRRQIDVFYLGVVDERNIERPVAHDQFHNFITFSYEQTLPGAPTFNRFRGGISRSKRPWHPLHSSCFIVSFPPQALCPRFLWRKTQGEDTIFIVILSESSFFPLGFNLFLTF